jgi:GMP synthase-like glutamine amidotransferase
MINILVIRNNINEEYNSYTFMDIHNTCINIIQSTDLSKYSLEELSEKYDKLIILGGKESVIDIYKYPYLFLIINLIHLFNDKNKHILGICLGCQLLAKTFGGTIKKLPKMNIRCTKNINIKENEIINIDNQYVLCYHEDYIYDVGNMEIIGKYKNIPYIIQKNNNILGVQYHPDIYIDRFINCVNKNNISNKEKIISKVQDNSNKINNYNREFMKKWILK